MELEGGLAFTLIVGGFLGLIGRFAFRSSLIKGSFNYLDFEVVSALKLHCCSSSVPGHFSLRP